MAAIVLHPRRLASAPLVAEELKKESAAATIKDLGIGPSEVDEIVVLVDMGKTQRPAPRIAYVRFTRDVEIEDLLNRFYSLPKIKEALPKNDEKPFAKETIDGKTCYSLAGVNSPIAYAPDKKTIVFADRESLASVLAGTPSQGPLYEHLEQIDAASDNGRQTSCRGAGRRCCETRPRDRPPTGCRSFHPPRDCGARAPARAVRAPNPDAACKESRHREKPC